MKILSQTQATKDCENLNCTTANTSMSDTEEVTEDVELSETDENFMQTFVGKVKRMCELEDEIKSSNKEKKQVTDEKKKLKDEVTTIMAEKNLRINYKTDVLFVDKRTSPGSLTRKTLINAIKDYYKVGDFCVTEAEAAELNEHVRNRLYDAEEIFQFINERLGVQEKVVLVRQPRDRKTRDRKPTKYSVFEQPKEDASSEPDVQEDD